MSDGCQQSKTGAAVAAQQQQHAISATDATRAQLVMITSLCNARSDLFVAVSFSLQLSLLSNSMPAKDKKREIKSVNLFAFSLYN